MTQIKHTPTPLHIEKDDDVHTFYFHIMQGDRMIARVSVASFEGDPQELVLARIWAEKIVRACNAHDDLVAALQELIREYKENVSPLDACDRATVEYCESLVTKAKAGAA